MCDTLYSIKENIFPEFFYLIKTFFLFVHYDCERDCKLNTMSE